MEISKIIDKCVAKWISLPVFAKETPDANFHGGARKAPRTPYINVGARM